MRAQLRLLTFPLTVGVAHLILTAAVSLLIAAFFETVGEPYRTVQITGINTYIERLSRTWDSWHYQAIANAGYASPTHAWPDLFAFFPLFQLQIRLLDFALPGSTVFATFAAGILNYLLFLTVLYGFVRRFFRRLKPALGEDDLRFAFVLITVLPFSFFFRVPYTEALFAALLFGCFYLLFFVRDIRLWLLPVAAFLLSMTRNTGILLSPALAVFLVLNFYGSRKPLTPWLSANRRLLGAGVLAIAANLLGLLSFMAYGWQQTGNLRISMEIQARWGRAGSELTFNVWKTLQDNWNNTRGLFHLSRENPAYLEPFYAFSFDLLAVPAVLLCSLIALWLWRRQLKEAAALVAFSLAALFLPLLGYSIISLNRYILVAPVVLLVPAFLSLRLSWGYRLLVLAAFVTIETALFAVYSGHNFIG